MDDVSELIDPVLPPAPREGGFFYVKRITGAVLLIVVAAVFFYSAWSKIYTDNAFYSFQYIYPRSNTPITKSTNNKIIQQGLDCIIKFVVEN